jgi:hypothetical protein
LKGEKVANNAAPNQSSSFVCTAEQQKSMRIVIFANGN